MAYWIFFFIGLLDLTWKVKCDNSTLEQESVQSTNYENYTLMQLFPMDEKQVKLLVELHDPDNKVEVLKLSRGFNDSTDVLVPPEKLDFINKYVKEHMLISRVKNENYGRSLLMESRTPRRRVMGNVIYQYNSAATFEKVITDLAKEFPDVMKLQFLGYSFEGRKMHLVKISQDFKANHPVIFIDAGVHAREWVAPAMALYLIQRLVRDPDCRKRELDGVDFYILPLVNPDGYEFSRSTPSNRMWRKTMSRNNGCYGVDGNRNYGFKWAVSGVSMDPCNKETFAGPKPFSEKETQNVRKVMMENKDRIKLYVSLHSYGQYLVYPWGYTGDILPPQWKKLDNLAQKVSAAVVRAGGDRFTVMSAGKWYPAAGGSDDFAFGVAGVPYSYTMELTNGYEFMFPEELLKSTLPKFYYGFRAMASHIREEFS